MSAETLHQAASLMRERAEEADAMPIRRTWTGRNHLSFVCGPAVGEHLSTIGSPAVALALADLLDALADRAEGIADSIGSPRVAESIIEGTVVGYLDALAVARAYLGEAS